MKAGGVKAFTWLEHGALSSFLMKSPGKSRKITKKAGRSVQQLKYKP
jgi:hypothetical protein